MADDLAVGIETRVGGQVVAAKRPQQKARGRQDDFAAPFDIR
jgi:hypothetical protein